MDRRSFLFGGAALGALGLPFGARAAALPASDKKVIFVFAPGGWDVTRAFAPVFSNPLVAMEDRADPASRGGLSWVSHPDRPSVDLFFENHHAESLLINGLMVRSIAHEICTMITLTGTTSGLAPDWPAVIASQDTTGLTLPHLVISGPSFAGDRGVAVARTGVSGQLEALISGQVEDWSQVPVQHPDRVAESLIDRYLARRAAARADAAKGAVEATLTGAYRDSMDKLTALKDLRYSMDFTASMLLEDQARVAVQALSTGVARCVTIAFAGSSGQGWDTHANNDALQSPLWEDLFAGLTQLMVQLRTTPGRSAPTLADETLVVVLSEMARTPAKNELDGKDHWPYTSALLVGPGITGDRVVGSFDDAFYGRPVDPGSAEIDDAGQTLSAEALGATLLAWADIDPGPYVSGVEPLTGVLS